MRRYGIVKIRQSKALSLMAEISAKTGIEWKQTQRD